MSELRSEKGSRGKSVGSKATEVIKNSPDEESGIATVYNTGKRMANLRTRPKASSLTVMEKPTLRSNWRPEQGPGRKRSWALVKKYGL